LQSDACESQLCIPDIMVWLLHKGDRSKNFIFLFIETEEQN